MKPLKAVASILGSKVTKPFVKKALKAGVSHVGKNVGKMVAEEGVKRLAPKAIEKSGDIIRKRLSQRASAPKTKTTRKSKDRARMTQHDVNTMINNLMARS